MPTGVKVTASKVAGTTSTGVESGRFIIAVPTQQGPLTPQLVKSEAQFAYLFGARTAAYARGYDAAELFFKEGGSELVVSRVFGPAAVPDSVELLAGEPGKAVIRVTSRVPGAGSGLHLEVGNGTVKLSKVLASGQKQTLETADGMIGAQSILDWLGESQYVAASWVGEADPSNATVILPANSALTGGLDDGLNATAANYLAAGQAAIEAFPGAAWSTPGFYPGLEQLAKFGGGLGAPLYVTGGDRAGGLAQFELGAEGLPDNVLAVYPWLRVPSGTSTRVVAPEAFVGAVRARAHKLVGFWRVPAGVTSAARWVSGLANYPGDDQERLTPDTAEARIIANVFVKNGDTVALSDYRAASATPANIVLASEADTVANLTALATASLGQYLFAPIDGRGQLYSQVESTLVGVLQPISDAGGLYARIVNGEEVDPGYEVTVDASNNEFTGLMQHTLEVRIAVRLSPTARLIEVALIQVPLNGTF